LGTAPTGILAQDIVRGEATVRSVDAARRLVTLHNAEGKTLTLKVGENVDLAKVKPGDRVDIAYYEAVAVNVAKPGTATRGVTGAIAVVPAEQSKVPAGAMVDQVTVTAEVAAIDLVAHTVSFRGPEGNLRTVTIKDPQVQQDMAALQVGDLVQVTYTEGIAIEVVPKATH
jgi:hypothetical protein